MKTLKVIPVMLVGQLMRNGKYSRIDYVDSAVITGLVAYFVWELHIHSASIKNGVESDAMIGIVLMAGYLFVDSFTGNLQDYAYLRSNINTGQMLLGLELISAGLAFITLS